MWHDLVMDREALLAFMTREFPQERTFGGVVEHLEPGRLRMRKPVGEANLRPGGTVSGPTMMTLVDTAFYWLVLAMVGPKALAVTTHLSIDFMRRPEEGDLVADAEMLKLGRSLAVGRVTVFSGQAAGPVAHATITYAIPPERPSGG